MKKKTLFLFLFLAFLLPCNVHAKEKEFAQSETYSMSSSALFPSTFSEGIISNPLVAQSPSGQISNSYSGAAKTKHVNVLYKALKGFKKSVNVKSSKIYVKDLHNALYQAFIKDYYIQDIIYNYRYSYSYNRYTGQVYTVNLYYSASKKTLTKRYNQLKNAVSTARNSIGTNLSKTEFLVKAHDYLIKRATYDIPYSKRLAANINNSNFVPDPNAHSAYGILCQKSGVCSGYAYAYRILLKEYGIDCKFVESENMNHAWNMVKLGNSWYHIDVTWDDPDASTEWTHKGSGDLIYYTYFLLNDSEMYQNYHNGWSSVSSASTTFSGMPRYSSQYQIFSNGNWYIMIPGNYESSHSYWRYSMTGEATKLFTSSSPFYRIKDRIFYQSDSTDLMSMNIDTSMPRNHIEQLTASGIPYGSAFSLQNVDSANGILYLSTQYGSSHTIFLNDYALRTSDYATSLTLSRSKITIKKGKSATLTATTGPDWSISDKVVFHVNSAGKKVLRTVKTNNLSYRFKGKKKGTATITVTVPNTNLKKICKITVK